MLLDHRLLRALQESGSMEEMAADGCQELVEVVQAEKGSDIEYAQIDWSKLHVEGFWQH